MNADWTIAGTASSRSASLSTITQFLPPISATTRLRCRLPGGTSAAARMISRPTGPLPVKAIVAVADERGARLALARHERDRAGRHAAFAQRAHDHVRTARRLLGGLEDDGV